MNGLGASRVLDPATFLLGNATTTTQSAPITAGTLALGSFNTTTGTYTLDGPVTGSNKVGTLAASVVTGSISFNNGAHDLTVGAGEGISGVSAAEPDRSRRPAR